MIYCRDLKDRLRSENKQQDIYNKEEQNNDNKNISNTNNKSKRNKVKK